MQLKLIALLLLFCVFLTFCSKKPTTPDLPSPSALKESRLVRTFQTWQDGIIMSTDPTGITFHPPSGHLIIVDSEINEINEIWNCENVFEVSLEGDKLFSTSDVYAFGGNPCPAKNKREPTGITFNPFDGFFYVTDDNDKVVLRYDENLSGPPLDSVFTPEDDSTAVDPEGITCDPNTGYLYVANGIDGQNGVPQVLVYNSQLEFVTNFRVADKIANPEGIAYSSVYNHLFLVSRHGLKICEYTLDGIFVQEYDISKFSPKPVRPNGLTFAPSSDPADNPNNFNLYIVDLQIDNDADPDQRDGMVYEVEFYIPKP